MGRTLLCLLGAVAAFRAPNAPVRFSGRVRAEPSINEREFTRQNALYDLVYVERLAPPEVTGGGALPFPRDSPPPLPPPPRRRRAQASSSWRPKIRRCIWRASFPSAAAARARAARSVASCREVLFIIFGWRVS